MYRAVHTFSHRECLAEQRIGFGKTVLKNERAAKQRELRRCLEMRWPVVVADDGQRLSVIALRTHIVAAFLLGRAEVHEDVCH